MSILSKLFSRVALFSVEFYYIVGPSMTLVTEFNITKFETLH